MQTTTVTVKQYSTLKKTKPTEHSHATLYYTQICSAQSNNMSCRTKNRDE